MNKGVLNNRVWRPLGVALLGLVACGIGVIPATCLLYVAWAIAFTRASGRAPTPPAPPPGGWR